MRKYMSMSALMTIMPISSGSTGPNTTYGAFALLACSKSRTPKCDKNMDGLFF